MRHDILERGHNESWTRCQNFSNAVSSTRGGGVELDVKGLQDSCHSYPCLLKSVSGQKIDHLANLLTRERREVTFKFLSWKTLIHCIWYFAPITIVVLLFTTQIMRDAQEISLEVFAGKNVVDQLSQYVVIFFGSLSSLHPFLIAYGLPGISELALAADLKFPKHGKQLLLAMAFLLASQIIGGKILIFFTN